MQWLAPYYFYIKFFHLFFVMMWAMSALGAYLCYLRPTIYALQADPGDKKLEERLVWAYEQFDKTVVFEHIAFPIVLISGLLMFLATGWSLETPWMLIKLLIVVLVFVPLEIADTWIAHVWGPRVSRERQMDPEAWNEMRASHWKFLRRTAPIIRYTVPIVIFLAVVKPSLWA
jgi:uncharacterized membrane protein